MSEKSMILDFAFGANSLINEGAKNAIEVAIKSKMFRDSIALKISGIKFGLVGNVDKGIKVMVAWDSGNGTPDAVGKAVFQSVIGVLGGIGGGLAGRVAGAVWAEYGGLWWGPVAGTFIGDYAGETAGGALWDALPASTRIGATCSAIDFMGLELKFCYQHPEKALPATKLPGTNTSYALNKTGTGKYDVFAVTPNQINNIITGERLVRDPDASNGNYTVQKGDTLSRLAIEYGTTVDEIKASNPQITNSKDWIWEGQKINIPAIQTTNHFDRTDNPKNLDPARQGATDRRVVNYKLSRNIPHDDGITRIASTVGPDVNKNTTAAGPADNAPAGFIEDPDSPLQHAIDALGLASKDVRLTPAEADDGNETPDAFDIRDNDTSDIIGSCVMTPGGCEMTAGDRKVVADRINGSDVNLETYAKNDEGDFEFLGMSRIGANDGITVRRPVIGIC
jgi:LysM repeat protein